MEDYLKKFKNYEPMTVVCVGDSTTSQEWLHPNWYDWLNFSFRQEDWKRGHKRKIINSGIDGAVIQDYLAGFEREIGSFNPDAVIMSLGFNDTGIGETKQVIEARLTELMKKIAASGAALITWSTYQVIHEKHNAFLGQVRDIYRELTGQFGGVFVDVYEEFGKYDLTRLFTLSAQDENEYWMMEIGGTDYVHTNAAGNQIIAEAIAREAFDMELKDPEGYGTMQLLDLNKYLLEQRNENN